MLHTSWFGSLLLCHNISKRDPDEGYDQDSDMYCSAAVMGVNSPSIQYNYAQHYSFNIGPNWTALHFTLLWMPSEYFSWT